MKIVTAGIICHGDTVLIARRAAGEKFAGYWEFPGGKLEPGETPEQGLQRELWEELGVQVEVGDFVGESTYEYAQGALRLLAYRVRLLSDALRLTVHDEYKYVEVRELTTYDLLPADIPLAVQLARE